MLPPVRLMGGAQLPNSPTIHGIAQQSERGKPVLATCAFVDGSKLHTQQFNPQRICPYEQPVAGFFQVFVAKLIRVVKQCSDKEIVDIPVAIL